MSYNSSVPLSQSPIGLNHQPRALSESERSASGDIQSSVAPPYSKQQFIVDRLKSRLSRLKRSVITSGRLHEEEIQAEGCKINSWMITLTYAPGIEWSSLHITETIKTVREWCKRRGIKFRYVWVAEIQETRKLKYGGHCLHYHIIVWLPKHLSLPKFDKRGWWRHGMTQTVKARSPVGYLAKYASKGGKSNQFPKGARICGCGGLARESRWQKAWWSMPQYVRHHFPCFFDRPTRLKGGGFYSRTTGEIIDSLYEVVRISPLIIQQKDVKNYGTRVSRVGLSLIKQVTRPHPYLFSSNLGVVA